MEYINSREHAKEYINSKEYIEYINMRRKDQNFLLERWNEHSVVSPLLKKIEYTFFSPTSLNIVRKINHYLRTGEYFMQRFDYEGNIKHQTNTILSEHLINIEFAYILFFGLAGKTAGIIGGGETSQPIFLVNRENLSDWIQVVLQYPNTELIVSSLDFSVTLEIEHGEDEFGKDSKLLFIPKSK